MRITRTIACALAIVAAAMIAGCENENDSAGGAYESPTYVPPPWPYDEPSPGDYSAPPPAEYGQPPAPDQAAPAPTADTVEGGQVSVDSFRNDLSLYGQWSNVPQYGQVWMPANVPPGWRPYTMGHWVWSDPYGWTWLSDEPWGWATCHYGRWTYLPQGWAWVPGTVWGPAWVAWRSGGGYCGWAPLPPSTGASLSITAGDVTAGIAASWFCFAPEREIFATDLHRHIVPVRDNITIINKTTNLTNITVVNKRVVNRSLDVHRVERVVGHPIQPVHVRAVTDPNQVHSKSRQEYDPNKHEVAIYRPPPAAHAQPGAAPHGAAPGVRTEPPRTPPPGPAATPPRQPAPHTETPPHEVRQPALMSNQPNEAEIQQQHAPSDGGSRNK